MSTGWPYKPGTKFTEVFTEVFIGQFADRDPRQGEAIDRSVKTGEPLFVERYVYPRDADGHYELPMRVGGQVQEFNYEEM